MISGVGSSSPRWANEYSTLHIKHIMGGCVKGFIGCTAWPIGPLYSTLRGLFTAPWNDL